MRKLITAGLAAAAILVAGSLVSKIEAAPSGGRRHAPTTHPELLAGAEYRLLVRPLSLRLRI